MLCNINQCALVIFVGLHQSE